MFKHAKSEKCRFSAQCKNKLCQFVHDSEEIIDDNIHDETNARRSNIEQNEHVVKERGAEQNDDKENDDLNSDSDSEIEEEDLECDECGKVSENVDAYIEHRGKGDCVFWCDHCDEFFRQEEDLKIHKEKHCTNCAKQFTTKNAFNSHKTTCNSIL